MITAVRSTPFETCYDSGVSGLTGIASVQIIDNIGNITFGPTTLGVVESPAGSGVYCNTLTAPPVIGQFTVVWSQDGTFDPTAIGIDDLIVISQALVPQPPLPGPAGGGVGSGPCSAWTTAAAAIECCSEVEEAGLLDDAVATASQVLWALSGKMYSGLCSKTVRPCRSGCACGGWQVLSRGHIVQPEHWGWCDGRTPCGCMELSRVLLSGYPVREVSQVKIDGAAIPDTEYRLDEYAWVTRLNGESWPACARLDLDDSEEGTWSITYQYGQEPPLIGQQAAAELACQIYLSCIGSSECRLPTGATRISRQGITIERQFFTYDRALRAWRTGLSLVDLFLNTYNSSGLQRRPAIWSPDSPRYARPVTS